MSDPTPTVDVEELQDDLRAARERILALACSETEALAEVSRLREQLQQANQERDRFRAAVEEMVGKKSLLAPSVWAIGEAALRVPSSDGE
jgi:hypothetical protein